MSFPDRCIKGIPNNQYLINGRVAPGLFSFDPQHAREDGWIEESINWEDDHLAIGFTLNQRKSNGEKQFQAGVAIVPRHEIDSLNKRPAVGGILSYERKCLENNPYHGNILLQTDVSKQVRRMIQAGLALLVSQIIPQDQD